MNSPSRFIATEPFDIPGREAERRVWDSVRAAFGKEDCLGYWRYPIFSKRGEARKEPDVLLASPSLGLVVIEVKGVRIEQIREVSGHRWVFDDYYQATGAPYQQAESQLWTLLGLCDSSPETRRRVPGRALVALPYVTRAEWQAHGWHELPNMPPVLLADDLSPVALRKRIAEAVPVVSGERLDPGAWRGLQAVLGGTTIPGGADDSKPASGDRAHAVADIRSRISALDYQQETIGKQSPHGPQQIRGIAGSGKTVLLCQKAAVMHLKHPEWDIALVFFTRSLYDEITRHVRHWVQRFSNGEQDYDPRKSKLRILHAWGARDQPGLYGEICKAVETPRLTVRDLPPGSPTDSLALACAKLLDEHEVPELFDAILIDEGQDLVADGARKWRGKQPIYWMAYSCLRPADARTPDSRRLIWAYDEAQSLDSLSIPMAKELFGDERARLTTGAYPGGIQRSEVMRRCYRTPAPLLVAAHALGMGLKRDLGMLSGYTRQEGWDRIGYDVEGDFTAQGNPIRLSRSTEHSPMLFDEPWPEPLARFRSYASREDELEALADAVQRDIDSGLDPCRDILVVTVGTNRADRDLRRDIHRALQAKGIDTFEPSATKLNETDPRWQDKDPNRFWHESGVTVACVHRAKGNEGASVHVAGLDAVAAAEHDVGARNRLFVAMSRARCWVSLSGTGDGPFYREVSEVLAETSVADDRGAYGVSFSFARPSVRDMGDVQADLFASESLSLKAS